MRTFLLSFVLLTGCSGGDDAAGPDADPGSDRAQIGSIRVIENHDVYDDGGTPVEYRMSSTHASFYDGGPPRFHHEVTSAGACTLRAYTPALCDPLCTDGLCVETDVCEPWGTLVSAGRLTFGGLSVGVTIDPESGYYYNQTSLPEDLFDDDATVTATLAGDVLAGATLTAHGVAPIVADIPLGVLEAPYPAGQDLVVSWTPAGDGSRVRLTLNANNQGHGMPYLAIIECDVADSFGEVSVPAAMLDAFPATEAWTICAGTDCPRSTITRYTRGAAPVGDDDELELVVGNTLSFGIHHPRP